MSIKPKIIIESFAQDVTSDAYLEALDKESGKITFAQLDKICMDHPWYDQIELSVLENTVEEIETHLFKEGKLATPISDRINKLGRNSDSYPSCL